MRRLFSITLSVLVLLALTGQKRREVIIGTEAQLGALSVAERGRLAVSTNASSASDCTFASGTGGFIVDCRWCDSTSAWIVADAECVAADEFLLLPGGVDYLLLPGGVDKMVLP